MCSGRIVCSVSWYQDYWYTSRHFIWSRLKNGVELHPHSIQNNNAFISSQFSFINCCKYTKKWVKFNFYRFSRELDRLLPSNPKKIGKFPSVFRAENGTLFHLVMQSQLYAFDTHCSNKTSNVMRREKVYSVVHTASATNFTVRAVYWRFYISDVRALCFVLWIT